ncbi:MAG TPA: flagellar basal body-associated protein FliL [Aliidiomarina sp.]|nr:flagellar basal body-associated protein FliL [Aliidiomarina sp.]
MRAFMFVLLAAATFVLSPAVQAQGQAYFGFEPDITTNYIRTGDQRSLGYVRVAIEVMVPSVGDLKTIEYHQALLRDAFIRILSVQSEERVRSLNGREEIRTECLEVAQELMLRETGKELVRDLIFTKYLYQ